MTSFKTLNEQPENAFFNFSPDTKIAIVPEFKLECGFILREVPVAYRTFGVLNDSNENCVVVCHALTGTANVMDWWGPLVGDGRALDTSKYFIFSANVLGSPYGSASPVTINPNTKRPYGPEFPVTTLRDDARIQRLILEDLGISSVVCVLGGSMGGLLALEYAYLENNFARSIVSVAASAKHSAWGISWGEVQRQCIYTDPDYADGYYTQQPVKGLSTARMAALLTYRSRDSFESRFGRDTRNIKHENYLPSSEHEEHWHHHNEGHLKSKKYQLCRTPLKPGNDESHYPEAAPKHFSAQSYMRYQGDKFAKRFDANCYIVLTRKLDSHDVSRNRAANLHDALSKITQPVLVIGVESDGLFTYSEQLELEKYIPNSRLVTIESCEGHDSFLMELDRLNDFVKVFMKETIDLE